MNQFKQKMERQLQAKSERGSRQPETASTQPETEERDPAEMSPEELDRAIEAQRALVRRLKEEELRAAREATQRGARRGLPFGASRRKIT
jgi:hypothetical protein